jgi:hypothetical protein
MLSEMTTKCAHCQRPATDIVPENPGHVCVTHATEYWTSLLAYVKKMRVDNAAGRQTLPAAYAA